MEKIHSHSEHNPEHASHAVKMKASTLWQIIAGVLAIVLVVSIVTGGFKLAKGTGTAVSADAAGKKAIDFINERLTLAGANVTATLGAITEKNGLYAANVDIGGQTMETFITKDGSLLFPQAIPLNPEATQLPADTTATNETAAANAQAKAQAAAYTPSDVPNFKMFVMAFCPYGQQAEAAVQPVAELFGDKIAFEPHYVIYSNYGNDCLDAEKKYCSLHGLKELKEDVRQMCIWKNYPAKWWDYASAINENCALTDIETCWSPIAQQKGIDVQKIKDCQANEAETLLAAELALDKEFGVTGSPTMFVNDEKYANARTADAIKTALCSAFTTAPADCDTALSATTAPAAGGCGA